MSGSRYLLDTNAIVALLQGNIHLIQLLQNANWIGISVISQTLPLLEDWGEALLNFARLADLEAWLQARSPQ